MYYSIALYPTLKAFRDGKLKALWEREAQEISWNDQKLSTQRAKELAAAKLSYLLSQEASKLEDRFKYVSDTNVVYDPTWQLIEWYLTENETSPNECLVDWSGSRTLVADTEFWRG